MFTSSQGSLDALNQDAAQWLRASGEAVTLDLAQVRTICTLSVYKYTEIYTITHTHTHTLHIHVGARGMYARLHLPAARACKIGGSGRGMVVESGARGTSQVV